MSQGAKDLPDPLDKPPPGPTPSADELLAKMAGDEIDRLLAEAEVSRDSAPVTSEAGQAAIEALQEAGAAQQPSAPASSPGEDVDSATAKQLDGLFEKLDKPKPPETAPAPTPPSPPPAPAAPAAQPSPIAARQYSDSEKLDEELENLYKQLDRDDKPPEAATPAKSAEPTPPAKAQAPGKPLPAPATPELAAKTSAAPTPPPTAKTDAGAQTGPDEKKALVAEILEAAASATRAQAASAPAKHRVPLYVRLLILINRPIDGCSDFVRNLIGKAAIATLVMSILTLTYVLIFRR